MKEVIFFRAEKRGRLDTKFIERRRKELGMNGRGFARRVGRSWNSLKFVINNNAKMVDLEEVGRIARILECGEHELIK